ADQRAAADGQALERAGDVARVAVDARLLWQVRAAEAGQVDREAWALGALDQARPAFRAVEQAVQQDQRLTGARPATDGETAAARNADGRDSGGAHDVDQSFDRPKS